MKKIISPLSILAAMLLMSATTAFSGTGPYGSFGPTLDNVSDGVVDNTQAALHRGTGPYGIFGPSEGYNIIQGAEQSPMASSWGTGPYGVFNSHGMVARDKSNKEECLLVAMYCPREEISR